ncbi:hypothetical protein [Mycobacterium ulcerans]|nr:hypothetical protein [Mycobacterium ulcerans]GAQ40485.1 hypothetical protein MPS_5221 [Mycobacterium pseudoshottsii JCM 15466]
MEEVAWRDELKRKAAKKRFDEAQRAMAENVYERQAYEINKRFNERRAAERDIDLFGDFK